MKKWYKHTPGAIVEIPLLNGEYYCYGQLLEYGHCAVFDFKVQTPLSDLSVLNKVGILFRVCIYRQVISQGDWLKVGKLPLREELTVFPDEFIYHDWNQKFFLYKVVTGEIIPASKEECRGLEPCAVWDSNHVEDRIVAYYNNEPCVWMKEVYEIFSD